MAANLTTEQRVAIVKLYYSSNSVTQVQRDWRKTFASVAPKRKTIYDLIHKFEATGSVLDAARSGRPRSVNTGEARVGLKEVLKRSPQKSSRQLSRELGVSHMSGTCYES